MSAKQPEVVQVVAPPMSDAERADLEAVKDKAQEEKLRTYYYMCSVAQMSEHELMCSGYRGKTNAEAVLIVLQRSMKDIEKMFKAHERKWPD